MINMKRGIALAGLAAVVGLTGCQTAPKPDPVGAKADKPHHGMWHKDRKMRNVSPEQREAMRQRHEAMNQACVGKAGQTVNVTVGDKTIQGTCETIFQPDRDAMRRAAP